MLSKFAGSYWVKNYWTLPLPNYFKITEIKKKYKNAHRFQKSFNGSMNKKTFYSPTWTSDRTFNRYSNKNFIVTRKKIMLEERYQLFCRKKILINTWAHLFAGIFLNKELFSEFFWCIIKMYKLTNFIWYKNMDVRCLL